MASRTVTEKKMTRAKLDDFEKQIEDDADRFVPVEGEERARVERILEKSRKTRNINIRISEHDLDSVKRRAEREGLPYQTLISSILHKYVSDQLVDERAISKTLQLIGKGEG
jgi:predicted DNA binding CopG/RHH family protein